jgi:hypothetical protein
MSMVEIARFSDPQEGHIAAGALRAVGIDAMLNAHGYGAIDFTMRQATHGFALFVESGKVDEARAMLIEPRTGSAEALAWTKHPQLLTGLPAAAVAVIDPASAMMIAGAKARPTRLRIAVAAIYVTLIVVGLTLLFAYAFVG